MTSERKVVVITGASRGIGAQLSKAYRHIGYQVIASSRSMRESDDPAILVIEGDITGRRHLMGDDKPHDERQSSRMTGSTSKLRRRDAMSSATTMSARTNGATFV